MACRVSGERPTGDLARWLESLPVSLRDKLASFGILDGQSVAAARPLTEHLDAWRNALKAKGNSAKHVDLVTGRARRVIRGCGFRCLSDILPGKAQQYLADRRDGSDGISAQTSNFYLSALKQFCAWMVHEGRASESPVAHMAGLNVRTDRRHDRRALSVDETQRLLAATRNGPKLRGMTGQDRQMLYLVGLETGLRWSELSSLTRESFDLAGDPPTVRVSAAYSKHGRDDTLPLRAQTALALREYFGSVPLSAKAFPMPQDAVGSKLLRVDLRAAGIQYEDSRGRFADFHALRHTFITNLANSGVHPSTAQHLARHSDINLTMSRYTHSALDRQSEAVERLPEIGAEPVAAQATGTEGQRVSAICLAKQERLDRTGPDESGRFRGNPRGRETGSRAAQTGARAHSGGGREVVRPAGLEPAACGLGNRRSIRLSYGRIGALRLPT